MPLIIPYENVNVDNIKLWSKNFRIDKHRIVYWPLPASEIFHS